MRASTWKVSTWIGAIRRAGRMAGIALTALFLVAGSAVAQQQQQQEEEEEQAEQQQQQQEDEERVQQRRMEDASATLENWDYEELYRGAWSAEPLLEDSRVFGSDGEEIGSAENLLINESGEIVALVAEVGGFWDISDTHIAVPWDQVDRQGQELHVPVSEGNVEDFSLFDDQFFTQVDVGQMQNVEDDLETGFNIFKATQVVGDYAVLEDGAGYGYIDDMLFNDEGNLQGVVISASDTDAGDPGYYAYPWIGTGYADYAWHPALDHYVLPYDQLEIDELSQFDYEQLEQRDEEDGDV